MVLQAAISSRSVRFNTVARRSDPRTRITASATTENVSPVVTVIWVNL